MYDSMNPTRLPKEVLPPDCARRDMQGTKGDRVKPWWCPRQWLKHVGND
jgi:hypothetical protein